jgi:hypothetical protein
VYVNRKQIPVFEAQGEMNDPIFAALGEEAALPVVDVQPAENRLLPRGTHLIVPAGSKFYSSTHQYEYRPYAAVEVVLQMDVTVRVREDQPGLVELDVEADVSPAIAFSAAASYGGERTLQPSETYKLLPGTDVTILEAAVPPPLTPPRVLDAPWYKRPRTYIAGGAVLVVLAVVVVALARSRKG